VIANLDPAFMNCSDSILSTGRSASSAPDRSRAATDGGDEAIKATNTEVILIEMPRDTKAEPVTAT